MARLLTLACLLIAGGMAQVLGQDTALVDPAAAVAAPDIPAVVTQCQLVAAGDDDDNSNSGLCLNATQSFLDGLAGGAPDAVDQQIAELVVALVPLVSDDNQCNAADDEVARAVTLASTYSSSPEQAQQLVDIADTVAACDGGATAAVLPDAPEASPV